MSEPDDATITLAVQGDANALSSLLEAHGTQVRARLKGKIASRYQAAFDEDDVMQVTYLEAFRGIGNYEPKDTRSFTAWLTRIAENNLRDAIKGLDRDKRPPREEQLVGHGESDSYVSLLETLGTTTTPSRRVARDEIQQVVDDAISRLPEDYASVVRMYDLEGRSGPEVAKAMRRSRGAVHMLRARAHDCLKESLGTESNFFSG